MQSRQTEQGICEVTLCKDHDGKTGLRLEPAGNGLFVQLVQANSPASLVGLRFGGPSTQVRRGKRHRLESDKARKVLGQAFGGKRLLWLFVIGP